MSTNQRTTSFFNRDKSHGKSLHIEHSFQTPKIHRNQPQAYNYHQKTSCSKHHKTGKSRMHSVNSEAEANTKHHHKWISIESANQFSPIRLIKGKEEQLRETDDSIRPKHRKRYINIKCFKIIKQLGRGKHGTVFLAMHRDSGFIGALKVFSKQQLKGQNEAERLKLQQELIRQFKIQSFVSHQHIIKLYSIFADKDFVYAFMELGSDGQLYQIFQKRKKLKEETISFIIRSLLQALNYLHSKGIIHRDIKPENIVLIHAFPKICDFGESNFFSKENGQLRQTLCGTPLYLSPQILVGDKYDEKIDIWALGAMAYELFTAMNPFNIKNKDELKRIITQQFKMQEGPIEICNFLTYCLKKNPLQRPTSTKLLKHPFILKWKELQTAQELCSQPKK